MDEQSFQERIARRSRAEVLARRVLDVAPGATDAELKAAHRRESKRYHPDRCHEDRTDARKFRLVQNAYRCLARGEECGKLLRALDTGELPAEEPEDGPNNPWAYFLRWRDRFF